MRKSLGICLMTLSAILFIHTNQALALTSVDISVNSSPEIPGPNQSATITISSYATDLEKATVSWYIDNKLNTSGVGKKAITLTTKGVGESTQIKAVIDTANGVTITKDIIIRPGDIDLIWEVSDATVPPFYKGKSLPSRESLIKVSAIPNMAVGGKWLQTEDLVFDWSLNSERNSAASGFNESSFLYRNSYLKKSDDVSVKASGITQNTIAQKSTSIVMRSPFVLFYEDSPALGIKYEKSLGSNVDLQNGSEINLVATPYFFSASDVASPELVYNWTINSNTIQTPSKKNRLTLRAPEVRGNSDISLNINVLQKLFQNYESDITVSY